MDHNEAQTEAPTDTELCSGTKAKYAEATLLNSHGVLVFGCGGCGPVMLFTVGQMQRTESGKTAKNSVDSDFQHFFFHWLNDNTGVFCFVCFVECTV